MNLVPFGITYDKPVGRTIEAIQIIRRLWSEDFVDFEGKYYSLKNAFLQPEERFSATQALCACIGHEISTDCSIVHRCEFT